jgi:teichuronic acid biosynthesis glycosyltransferase TuaC
MIKVLTFTTLYPNAKQPSHGIFVENRLAKLAGRTDIDATVIAPVAYVPEIGGIPNRYRVLSDIPLREQRRGRIVHHPRYFLLPKVSMSAAPLSLYLAARQHLAKLVTSGFTFDLIDAHYFYPDGVAAMLLGRHFNKPVIITAHGSDINIIPRFRLPRGMIRWAAAHSAAIVTVCDALKKSLIGLGIDAAKIHIGRNGVDLARFQLGDRDAARQRIGFTGTTLLSVGNLIPLKGHDLAIKALALLPEARLAIVGDGPERANLEQLATRLGIGDRVRFFGRVPHDALPEIYLAADALLLLSTSEGLANVLLEAMACGTPVVATPVGGTPEVITSTAVGELVLERNPATVAALVAKVMERGADRRAARTHAEAFSWEATTNGLPDLFRRVVRTHATKTGMKAPEREVGSERLTL